ncbi:MAG: hypothetical protein HKO08_00135 [Erythrobacter sp.]|nr:hypothetical protein [Erythrobacter sp.]
MPNVMSPIKATALAAASLAMAAPGIVSGQTSSGSGPHYHLVQLSIESSEVSRERFSEETRAIRDCGDARDVGEAIGADIKKNRWVPAWKIPKRVRAVLKDVETGQATEVFSNEPGILRVLVICHRY